MRNTGNVVGRLKMKKVTTVLLITMTALVLNAQAFAGCGTCDKTIVENAVESKFNTLVAAVKAADLVETLSGKGPFTVFAPTDEAFKKLPAGTVESLLKPENKEKLIAVLKYHVVPGNVMAKDVVKLNSAKTAQGTEVKIKVAGESVNINNAKVVKADVRSKNGVIHVIDTVLIPSS
jgi:uncharacterized surface protein with fasciclin (FAS1) repeats